MSSTENMLCHVDETGKFTRNVIDVMGNSGSNLIGQDVLKGGSKAILDLLQSIGCLVKVEAVKHRYPYDWKTDKPVIMMYETRTLLSLLRFNLRLFTGRRLSGLRIWMISKTVQ